jgi:hypothetical protein
MEEDKFPGNLVVYLPLFAFGCLADSAVVEVPVHG